jgi:histidinol phosphatase-like PHP family hydrolase/predicted nuclease with RNAse H fold/dephospho-CoA kinase
VRPDGEGINTAPVGSDYFRVRDFEYVQPLYDLAFLLEIEALAKAADVPKYRTFSLWRAGYRLDSYGTTVDRWLDGTPGDECLDNIPSSRIRQYLTQIRETGTIPELDRYRVETFDRCLRLRSIRGLGPSGIASTLSPDIDADTWIEQTALSLGENNGRVKDVYYGNHGGLWQTAHIIPPLLRFLKTVQEWHGAAPTWALSGIADPFEPATAPVNVETGAPWDSLASAINKALERDAFFHRDSRHEDGCSIQIKHQMGWTFSFQPSTHRTTYWRIPELACSLDPIACSSHGNLVADLHLHTAWSDGSASVNTMAAAISAAGLQYFAVTDHSRSSKLQGGLTPPLWLRQANALTLAAPVCPVLHGIEVDILKNGALDLPDSLLCAADLVVASVHSNWTDDIRLNTNRLLRAIESGSIDIIAHPTSAMIGKPGVPNYLRAPAAVNWDEVFEKCALWRVALEFNCFPSRLDLPLNLLRQAIDAGCAISVGSDAHARSHLLNLRFGEAALSRFKAPLVLNRLSFVDLRKWIAEGRAKRKTLPQSALSSVQSEFSFETASRTRKHVLAARIQAPQNIPSGSMVVGIDLTAGDKATGIAVLHGCSVDTCSLTTDDEILAYIREYQPKIVSIDSPLGLPGGGDSIDPKAGIMREAERDLASIGIPAYPSLIGSMQNLTLRGIRLRRAIERFPRAPRVIESYPGAAQDILCIPRKQTSLELLREGLRRLGLVGPGLDTRSHDEMDAITSAIVGRYFEADLFEPMGIPSEAQLIVPKVRPLTFENNPVICLAGKTGAGKSVVARYLSVFYGFEWIHTRDLIRELLIEDLNRPPKERFFRRRVDANAISEMALREFGAIILQDHKQLPLRQKLTELLKQSIAPVVVDSIRDVEDVGARAVATRPILTWFVECDDSIIRARLTAKTKFGDPRPPNGSPVDRTAVSIRRIADRVILNNGPLGDLRWGIDDALFAVAVLSRDENTNSS